MRGRIGHIASGTAVLLAVLALLGGGYYLGFEQGKKQSDTIVVEGVANIAPLEQPEADFGLFWQTWKTINEGYLNNKDVGGQEKVYGAVRGLVQSLGDPYSEFYTPIENKQFQEDVQGNFSGIGAEIGLRDGQLTIISPLKESPAERAGLQPGDKVFGVNGTSTDGLSIDQSVRLIRGPEGTEVALTVFREGWERTRDITIVRRPIVVPTLDFEMKDGIAYVALYHFNANAPQLFAEAAVAALRNDARGMVLDLRNNPGGYLEVSVNLAGWFLPKGSVVVSERSRAGTNEGLKAQGSAALGDLPVVVLINQGSASASEILAGALRDQRGVKLVGEQSYGKGTVQEIFPLKNDASVKLTIANWVLPKGQVLEGEGLKPDYEVKRTEEDIEAKRDPQKDKAFEVLRSQLR